MRRARLVLIVAALLAVLIGPVRVARAGCGKAAIGIPGAINPGAMTFEAGSSGFLEHMGSLSLAAPVTVRGTPSPDAPCPDADVPAETDVEQFALPRDTRPIILFFSCRFRDPLDVTKLCHCGAIRHFTFGALRPAGVGMVEQFRWIDFDVDLAGNAPVLRAYRNPNSPVLVYCDPLGEEVNRRATRCGNGELEQDMRQLLTRAPTQLRNHQRRIDRLNRVLVAGWQALLDRDPQAAIRNFRSVEEQAQQHRYVSFREGAGHGLEACVETGLVLVSRAAPSAEAPAKLRSLRNIFAGLEEVTREIDREIEGRNTPRQPPGGE